MAHFINRLCVCAHMCVVCVPVCDCLPTCVLCATFACLLTCVLCVSFAISPRVLCVCCVWPHVLYACPFEHMFCVCSHMCVRNTFTMNKYLIIYTLVVGSVMAKTPPDSSRGVLSRMFEFLGSSKKGEGSTASNSPSSSEAGSPSGGMFSSIFGGSPKTVDDLSRAVSADRYTTEKVKEYFIKPDKSPSAVFGSMIQELFADGPPKIPNVLLLLAYHEFESFADKSLADQVCPFIAENWSVLTSALAESLVSIHETLVVEACHITFRRKPACVLSLRILHNLLTRLSSQGMDAAPALNRKVGTFFTVLSGGLDLQDKADTLAFLVTRHEHRWVHAVHN